MAERHASSALSPLSSEGSFPAKANHRVLQLLEEQPRNKALIFFKAAVETRPYFLPAGLGLTEAGETGHLVSGLTCCHPYLHTERRNI
jgi:hypothetical protein